MAGLGFAVWGLGLMGLKVYEIYEALVFIKSPSFAFSGTSGLGVWGLRV